MAQRILKPNSAELDWIRRNVQSVLGLMGDLKGTSDQATDYPVALDAAYAAWHAQHNRETEDPNPR